MRCWARRYLFTPFVGWFRRLSPSTPAKSLHALALLFSFAGIGFAHDVGLMIQGRVAMHGTATLTFVGLGVLVLVWPAWLTRPRPGSGVFSGLAQAALRLVVLFAVAALVLDVLAGAPLLLTDES